MAKELKLTSAQARLNKKSIDDLLEAFEKKIVFLERNEPESEDFGAMADYIFVIQRKVDSYHAKLDVSCADSRKKYLSYAARFFKLIERSRPGVLESSRDNKILYA